MHLTCPLVLASASPRRADLLRALGITKFAVRPTHADETVPPALDPAEVPAYLSNVKSRAADAYLDERAATLAADSLVLLDDEILAKPADLDEARVMLQRICGRTHVVITGFTIAQLLSGHELRRETRSVSTAVTLAEATSAEIEHYLATAPPLDRAGAYGIQDWIGAAKATRIEGSYTNVVGLPTAEVYALLREFRIVQV